MVEKLWRFYPCGSIPRLVSMMRCLTKLVLSLCQVDCSRLIFGSDNLLHVRGVLPERKAFSVLGARRGKSFCLFTRIGDGIVGSIALNFGRIILCTFCLALSKTQKVVLSVTLVELLGLKCYAVESGIFLHFLLLRVQCYALSKHNYHLCVIGRWESSEIVYTVDKSPLMHCANKIFFSLPISRICTLGTSGLNQEVRKLG